MDQQGPQGQGGPPPQAVVMMMLMGKYASMGLSVCAELRIPDYVGDGAVAASELAEKSGANADALYRIMRALAAVGVFVEEPGRKFRNTPVSSVLREDVPGSLCALARWEGSEVLWKFVMELSHTVTTGQPAKDKVFPGARGVFDILKQHGPMQQVFQEAMTALSAESGRAAVEAYDFSGFEHIVDVGGGHGALAMFIKDQAPNAKVTLFDLPHVVEGAQKLMASMGRAGAVETVAGSFFETVPAADAYIMKFITHDWPDDECLKVLTHCRTQLSSPSGKVLVCDAVVGNGPDSIGAKFLDIAMMVGLGGRERTQEEFVELFARAGLKLDRVIPTRSMLKILELSPA